MGAWEDFAWAALLSPAVGDVNPVKLTELESLTGWWKAHAEHGRCGPYRDATIGEYHTWRCPCGARWQCTEQEIERYPERCRREVCT